ncbi:DnaA ATPase domain-containing protein [[Clostridium] colinum]|uniref:DnaA ATPase domain-containing protein n=1 Tax=[Clostridium] colinum TaxID=36835 RepID=UPI002023D762|nr:DnaA/Hda family protein [[Clostridium] colinum]
MNQAIKDKLQVIQQLINQQPTRNSENLHHTEHLGVKNCPICKGDGIIFIAENGKAYSKYCSCLQKKMSQERFSKTEIANKDSYTFKNFKAVEEWQKNILRQAIDYVSKFKDNWFYIGGQVGAGKTHICTAILRNIGELNNISYMYIKCDEELEKLKQLTYGKQEKQEEYSNIMYRLKNTGLLFIDDFFRKEPTEADKAKMFDIINFRYLNNKPCIFSSEKSLLSILDIDEAIGSRIFEKAKIFNIEIGKDMKKNYRLKI